MFLADKLSDQGIRVLKIPESCLQLFLCYESPCPLTYFGLPIHIEHPTEPCLSQGNQSALGSRHQWAQPQLKTRSIMQIPQAWGSSLYWGEGVGNAATRPSRRCPGCQVPLMRTHTKPGDRSLDGSPWPPDRSLGKDVGQRLQLRNRRHKDTGVGAGLLWRQVLEQAWSQGFLFQGEGGRYSFTKSKSRGIETPSHWLLSPQGRVI